MSNSSLIREARLRLGLTQHELAEIAKVSQGSISKWETGQWSPRPEDIAPACWKILGLQPEDMERPA